MVYVKVPPVIMLHDRVVEDGKIVRKPAREMCLVEVIDLLTNDPYFAKPKMAKVAQEILSEFEDAEVGAYVRLTSEQHGHIKAVLDNPASPMMPAFVSKQIVPFFDALLEPFSEEQYSKERARAKREEVVCEAPPSS